MEELFFDRCFKRNARIRWVCKFLKYSGFIDLNELRRVINEKVERIERRKGPLEEKTVSKIVENLIWAKIAKRYLDKRIRPYRPRVRKQSITNTFKIKLAENGGSYEQSAAAIFKEKHYRFKTNPSILIPGFLPDGNEAFFLVRKCFLKFGSVYYLNYPTRNFNKETIFHQIYDMIVSINNRKFKNAGQSSSPFLVGTSFGCHMIINFLYWLRDQNLLDTLKIKGIVLISPVLCLEDIVDQEQERQKTLVGRAVANLLQVESDDLDAVHQRMERARSILMKMFTSGRDLMNFEAKDLIPVFAIEDDVLRIFDLEDEDLEGYFDRFLEMKEQKPIDHEFLTGIPVQVLFAEGEQDVLTPNSPTFKTFSDINQLRKIFPNGTVEFVHSNSEKRKVTHSDLIFQADRFKEHLSPWLERLTT